MRDEGCVDQCNLTDLDGEHGESVDRESWKKFANFVAISRRLFDTAELTEVFC